MSRAYITTCPTFVKLNIDGLVDADVAIASALNDGGRLQRYLSEIRQDNRECI